MQKLPRELKYSQETLPILLNCYTRLFPYGDFPELFDTFVDALDSNIDRYGSNFRQAVTVCHALGKLERYDELMDKMFNFIEW